MEHLVEIVEQLALCPPAWGITLYPDRGAPRFLSYQDLSKAVINASTSFAVQGIGPRSRVLVPFDTSLEVIVSFLALASMGAWPLSVKPYARGQNPDDYSAFLARVCGGHAASVVLDVPGLPRALPLSRLPLAKLDLREGSAWPRLAARSDEIAFVQFSSGSTSFPKGIPISHAKLVEQVRMIVEFDRREPGFASASWLPLFHDMGLIGGLLSCLYGQLQLHLCSPARFLLDPLGWLQMLSRERIRGFAIPNFGIEYLLRFIADAAPEDLADLRFDALQHVYVGAEPIDPAALRAWVAFMVQHGMSPIAVQPAYGMAEAVLMVTAGRDSVPRTLTAQNGQECISVGRPLPGVELRLVHNDESTFGEIEVRGGTVVGEYFGVGAPAFLNADGFYPTGDLGFMDAGELFVVGRLNDRIKVAAESYFAHDLEHVIEKVPGIRARRALVLQSQGRIRVLLEVPRANARTALKAAVRAKLAAHFGFSLPLRDILFLRPGQIRRTSSGKLRRVAMLEAFEANALQYYDAIETRLEATGTQATGGG
jgi:fatty-acyl-CoA synthase